jgi:hypothetical protein
MFNSQQGRDATLSDAASNIHGNSFGCLGTDATQQRQMLRELQELNANGWQIYTTARNNGVREKCNIDQRE